MRWKLCELGSDFIEGQTDSLREDDECDPAKNSALISPLASGAALGRDQAAILVEAQGGCGHSAAAGDISNQHL
jgi:hypothetical protein